MKILVSENLGLQDYWGKRRYTADPQFIEQVSVGQMATRLLQFSNLNHLGFWSWQCVCFQMSLWFQKRLLKNWMTLENQGAQFSILNSLSFCVLPIIFTVFPTENWWSVNMALLRPSSSGSSPTSLVRRALSAIRSIVIPQKDCQIITSCPGGAPLHVLPPTSFSASSAAALLTPFPVLNKVVQEQPVLEPGHGARRGFASSGGVIKATLFPGDGIGPEIAESVKKVTGRL